MKFTSNTYSAIEKQFIPIDELIETKRFNNLTTAKKLPLYIDENTSSKWSTIICQGKEVNCVGKNYNIIQHQEAFIQVIDVLNKAGITIQGRVNDFGKVAWMDMIFENLKIQDPVKDTQIELGYSVRSGYSFHGLNLIPFAVRGICSNGMIFNQTPKLEGLMDPINVTHVGNAKGRLINKMKTLIQDTLAVKNVFIEMFDKASKEYIRFETTDNLKLVLSQFGISGKQSKEMLKRGEIDLANCSKYELYNCLTEYATWANLSPGQYEMIQNGAERLLNTPLQKTKM